MRRLTIAAFLLLLMPGWASACFDEHKAGWVDEMPSSTWQIPRNGEEGLFGQENLGVRLLAAGLASVALIVVSFRALTRAKARERMQPVETPSPTPMALPFDLPERTIRVDQGHEPAGPNALIREDCDSPGFAEASADWVGSDRVACPIS
jgi:hypothetical protein